MKYSLRLQQLIEAIRRLSLKDDRFLPPTQKQLSKMNIQFNETLGKRKDLRVKIISELTGLPITSTKQLTRFTVSVIIDQTLDGKENECINELADALEN
jgi:hypothetical protein